MCGIAGFLAFGSRNELNLETLHKMVEAMHHRGPDGRNAQVYGPAGLGMSRLAIIDPGGSDQPIANETNDVHMVFNGEIYNYVELREELMDLGHAFKTRGDGETIVHGYEEWGEAVLEKLNGMFAIAVWDDAKGKLLLARDRMGIKPLYMHLDGKRLVFASEIKALLSSGVVEPELRGELLEVYLAFRYVPAPDCLFRGIIKLKPGEYYVHEGGKDGFRDYFKVSFTPRIDTNEENAIEELRGLFLRSVELRLRSDAPLGVFLSGGLDSSFLVALVREFSSSRLDSFSIGFDRGGIYNELDAASTVAGHFGVVSNKILMGAGDFIRALPSAVYFLEEPMADPSSVPMRRLALLAGEKVKVVLSGEGGDELFLGYGRHIGEISAARSKPASLCAHLASRTMGRFLSRRLRRGLKGMSMRESAARHLYWESIIPEEMRSKLLAVGGAGGSSEGSCRISPLEVVKRIESLADSGDPLDLLVMLDLRSWLVEDLLLKKDKMGMSASIEARVPFLDHNLVEYACKLDPNMKIKKTRGKHILRRLLAEYLPRDILGRPKIGFAVPIAGWFREELRPVLQEFLIGNGCFTSRYLDNRCIETMLAAHFSGDDLSLEIYTVLVLELWGRIFIRGEAPGEMAEKLSFAC